MSARPLFDAQTDALIVAKLGEAACFERHALVAKMVGAIDQSGVRESVEARLDEILTELEERDMKSYPGAQAKRAAEELFGQLIAGRVP